jgi:hypothetical protein
MEEDEQEKEQEQQQYHIEMRNFTVKEYNSVCLYTLLTSLQVIKSNLVFKHPKCTLDSSLSCLCKLEESPSLKYDKNYNINVVALKNILKTKIASMLRRILLTENSQTRRGLERGKTVDVDSPRRKRVEKNLDIPGPSQNNRLKTDADIKTPVKSSARMERGMTLAPVKQEDRSSAPGISRRPDIVPTPVKQNAKSPAPGISRRPDIVPTPVKQEAKSPATGLNKRPDIVPTLNIKPVGNTPPSTTGVSGLIRTASKMVLNTVAGGAGAQHDQVIVNSKQLIGETNQAIVDSQIISCRHFEKNEQNGLELELSPRIKVDDKYNLCLNALGQEYMILLRNNNNPNKEYPTSNYIKLKLTNIHDIKFNDYGNIISLEFLYCPTIDMIVDQCSAAGSKLFIKYIVTTRVISQMNKNYLLKYIFLLRLRVASVTGRLSKLDTLVDILSPRFVGQSENDICSTIQEEKTRFLILLKKNLKKIGSAKAKRALAQKEEERIRRKENRRREKREMKELAKEDIKKDEEGLKALEEHYKSRQERLVTWQTEYEAIINRIQEAIEPDEEDKIGKEAWEGPEPELDKLEDGESITTKEEKAKKLRAKLERTFDEGRDMEKARAEDEIAARKTLKAVKNNAIVQEKMKHANEYKLKLLQKAKVKEVQNKFLKELNEKQYKAEKEFLMEHESPIRKQLLEFFTKMVTDLSHFNIVVGQNTKLDKIVYKDETEEVAETSNIPKIPYWFIKDENEYEGIKRRVKEETEFLRNRILF